MQTTFRRTLVLLAALALFAPAATATWYTRGTHEPDNGLDSESFMFFDPPGVITNRIYFNAFAGVSYGLIGGTVSPNIGALETRNEAPTAEMMWAYLGVWVDCNGDGYIGMAAGALAEYPADLLFDTTICPPVTTTTPNAWTAGAHNYNGWVSEYIPIAGKPAAGSNVTDRRVYEDLDAMVWADYGLPDDTSAGGGTCPVDPQPRGTFQSTGGLINFADCSSGAMGHWNNVWTGRDLAGQPVPGLNNFGIDLGLQFENEDDARGSWADEPTFGSEDSSNAAVYIVDCSDSAPPTFHSGDFLNETPVGPLAPASVQNESIRAIDPRTGNVGDPRFLPGQVNQTNEELLSDCDTSNDDGHDFYVLEGDFNGVKEANKTESNINFAFRYVIRGGFGVGPAVPVVGGPTGFNPPVKLLTSAWTDNGVFLKLPATVRANVAQGTAGFADADITTFYAYVGAKTTGRGFVTPGGSGVYASAQCGDNTEDILGGWNCNAGEWYLNPDGTPMPEPTPLARPGQKYQLRDIDCHDGAVGDSGIGLGAPYYGTGACTPPSE